MRPFMILSGMIFLVVSIFVGLSVLDHTQGTEFVWAFFITQPIIIMMTLVFTWRSFVLSRGQVSPLQAFKANSLVYLGMWLVPARMSEMIKPFYFKKTSKLPQQQGWALVVKERVWDLFGFACTSLLTFGLLMDRWAGDSLGVRVIMLVGVTLIILAVFFILPRVIHLIPILNRFDEFAKALKKATPFEHATQACTALLLWFLSIAMITIYYHFSGLPPLPVADLMLIFMVSSLGLVVTVTPAGLGTYEAALVAILASYGIGLGEAVAFAIGFRLCWMLVPSLIGVWVILRDGVNYLEGLKRGSA